jgi:cysteine-rich repeat protein
MVVIGAAMAQAESETESPTSATNDNAIGFFPWADLTNVFTSNDTYSFSTSGLGNDTQYLKTGTYGFTIPAGAIILGIEVDIEKQSDLAMTFDNAVRIVKGGVVGATDRSDGAAWPALVDTTVTYGSPTDLWGETWTATDINAAGFGAAVSAGDSLSGDTCRVDHMPITVYYASCGDGIVTSPTEQCDDGNTANGDCCSSTCQFEANGSPCADDNNRCNFDETCDGAGECVSATVPLTTCRTAKKSILIYKNKSPDTKDKLIWKWLKGQSTTFAEFGTPTAATEYTLCLYAGTAALGDATILPSATNWKVTGGNKGYKFKDKSGTPDGITKAILKASASNKSKVIVKGKGANLPDLAGPPFGLPVTVQLVNSANQVCFTSAFNMPKKNVGTLFKAKTILP